MEFKDIICEYRDNIMRIILNRPERYNAFTINTLKEMHFALEKAELDENVRVIVLRGAGDKAFCAGGDLKEGGDPTHMTYWHMKVLHTIRAITKPVIAAVNGWAVGGGCTLHIVCDLSIAAETAKFAQTDPRIGSFDGGFGAAYLARIVGEKKAREIWFLCRTYTAHEALEMGLVNKVVRLTELDAEVERWCKEIIEISPTALKFMKAAFNADTDHIFGFQTMSEIAVKLFWESEEAKIYKKKFLEKKKTKTHTQSD